MKLKILLLLLPFLPYVHLRAQTEKANTTIDNIGQFVTPAGGMFLGLTGIKTKHSFKERVAVTATSLIVDEIFVQSLKYSIHSQRPDGTDNKSFPSGHTSISFVGAEIIREEYGWKWGLGAYAIACGVGALRIYHHRHRFVDVLAGAGIGFASARLGYLLLPLESKLFGWDKSAVMLSMTPFVGKSEFGGSLNLIF